MIVAIDGPAGSGKSTVARVVAREEGSVFLDTGAMYRSVALLALRRGVALDDERALGGLAASLSFSFGRDAAGSQTVAVNGEDVTAAIRTPEVDAAVSRVSAVPAVRAELVERQRAVAAGTDVVAEGRDIGTVVFPDAEVKVFMTASPRARAARRCAQMGEGADEAAVLAAIVERDRADSSRAVSPLTCAPDAVRIDSSELTVDEVVRAVRDLVAQARRNQR